MDITYWKNKNNKRIFKVDCDTSSGMSFINENVLEKVNEEQYIKALKEHQEDIGELWGAEENCWHELNPTEMNGIRCLKCGGWYYY